MAYRMKRDLLVLKARHERQERRRRLKQAQPLVQRINLQHRVYETLFGKR